MSGTVKGSVVSVSDSGNLVTDISEDALSDAPRDESVAEDKKQKQEELWRMSIIFWLLQL